MEIVVDDSYPEWKRESDTLGIYKYGLFNTLKGFILCERPAEGGEKIRVPVPACSVVEVTVKQPGELFGVVRGLRTLPPSHRELLGLKESEQPGTRLRGDQDPSPGRRAWKHLLYHGTRLKGKANVSDHFSEEEQGLPVDGNLFEEGFSRMGIRESSNESLLPRLHDPQEQSLGSVEKEEDTDGIPIELLPRTRASKKPRVAPPPTARAEEDEDEFRRGFKEAYDGSHSVAMVRRKEGRRKGEKLARFDVEAQHPIEMAAGKHSWGYVAGFRAGTTAFQDELKAKQHALGIGENGMPIYVWREDEFGRYPEKIVK